MRAFVQLSLGLLVTAQVLFACPDPGLSIAGCVAAIDADADGAFKIDDSVAPVAGRPGCPTGFVLDGTPVDCDDDDPDVYPGADEACDDGIDNNCDELIDAEDDGCDDDSGPKD